MKLKRHNDTRDYEPLMESINCAYGILNGIDKGSVRTLKCGMFCIRPNPSDKESLCVNSTTDDTPKDAQNSP